MSNLMIEVKALIESKIKDCIVEVSDLTGTQDHLNLMVASDVFQGHPLLEQHRLVMDALKERFEDQLHAVKIKTMTKQQYQSLSK